MTEGSPTPDSERLDQFAEDLLADLQSESEEEAEAAPASGLDWIRKTLRTGGAHEDSLLGTLFQGKYRILRRIGKGGFGAVYEALDERGAKNRVALKIQLASFAATRERRETFRNEAIRVTRLNHPNIVDWKSFDETPDGGSYFVMELLDGVELSAALKREGPFEWNRAVKLLLQILGALRAAHFVAEDQSILHLDLKPKNILLLPARPTRPEQVKVIDFGIGQFLGAAPPTSITSAAPEPEGTQSAPPVPARLPERKGSITAVSGATTVALRARIAALPFELSHAYTAEYASPEHCVHIEFADGADCHPKPLDGRADLYSFGIVAYELLTGRLPWKTPGLRQQWLQIHQQTPIDAWGDAESKVPAGLRKFVERCLEKAPEDRYPDTRRALETLERIAARPLRRRLGAAAVGLVLVGVAIAQMIQTPGGRLALHENGEDLQTHHHGPGSAPWVVSLQEAQGSKPLQARQTPRLVAGEGDALVGWRVTATEVPGQFLIAAPPDMGDGRLDFPRARLETAGGKWRSDPFELIWLGADTASGSLRILDRELQASASPILLDPQGLQLELELSQLRGTDLLGEDWKLQPGNQPSSITTGANQELGAAVITPLGDLALGPVMLELHGQDLSGRRYAHALAIEVLDTQLELSLEVGEANAARGVAWSSGEVRTFFTHEVVELILRSDRALKIQSSALSFRGETSPRENHHELRIPLSPTRVRRDLGPDPTLDLLIDDGVLHEPTLAGSRHTLRLNLHLRVREAPSVRWSLVADDPRSEFESGPDGPIVSAGRRPIRLAGTQSLPADRIEIEVRVNHGPARILSPGERRLEELLGPADERPPDGLYHIQVATHLLENGQRATLVPLSLEDFSVLVDTQAPVFAAPPQPPQLVRGTTEDWVLELPYPKDAGSRIALTWTLRGRGGGRALHVGTSLPGAPESGTALFSIAPLQTYPEAARLADGHYEVSVEAIDRAGNQANVGTFEMELARQPPSLLIQSPAQEVLAEVTAWKSSGRDLEEIRVEVFDPNGVASVECTVYRLDADQGRTSARFFRPSSVNKAPRDLRGQWTWTFEPPPSWSRASDVMMRFKAVDLHGQGITLTHGPLQLPPISEAYPERLQGMWLVPGNPDDSYVFKGRASVLEENRCFSEAGLHPLWVGPGREKPGKAESAWALTLAPGEIKPYYLGELEVRCGEFLRFLEDVNTGYMDRSHWNAEQVPSDARRRELLELYRQRNASEPATDVWQREASAYAHSRGMRLPTLLELTFTVRGGPTLYRAFSWDTHSKENLDPGSPWFRVRGLSRDAEWTSSSVQLDAITRLPIRPGLAQHFLHPPSPGRRVADPYWIAGTPGGYLATAQQDRRLDFAAVDVGDPHHWTDARVGFRLAASADRAIELARGEQGKLGAGGVER